MNNVEREKRTIIERYNKNASQLHVLSHDRLSKFRSICEMRDWERLKWLGSESVLFSSKGGGEKVFCFVLLSLEADEQVGMGDMMTCNETCRLPGPCSMIFSLFFLRGEQVGKCDIVTCYETCQWPGPGGIMHVWPGRVGWPHGHVDFFFSLLSFSLRSL